MKDETELQILIQHGVLSDFFPHSTTPMALKALNLWFDSEALQK